MKVETISVGVYNATLSKSACDKTKLRLSPLEFITGEFLCG